MKKIYFRYSLTATRRWFWWKEQKRLWSIRSVISRWMKRSLTTTNSQSKTKKFRVYVERLVAADRWIDSRTFVRVWRLRSLCHFCFVIITLIRRDYLFSMCFQFDSTFLNIFTMWSIAACFIHSSLKNTGNCSNTHTDKCIIRSCVICINTWPSELACEFVA